MKKFKKYNELHATQSKITVFVWRAHWNQRIINIQFLTLLFLHVVPIAAITQFNAKITHFWFN